MVRGQNNIYLHVYVLNTSNTWIRIFGGYYGYSLFWLKNKYIYFLYVYIIISLLYYRTLCMMYISLTHTRGRNLRLYTYNIHKHMHSVLQIIIWHGLVHVMVKWFKHVSLNSMYTSSMHGQYVTSLPKYVNTPIYTCFFHIYQTHRVYG